MRLLKLLFVLFLTLSAGTIAAEEDIGVDNYAYSVFSGTGRYRTDDRTIYVFRAPLSWDLKEANYEESEWGYTLLLPVAVGITNFDEITGIEDLPDISFDDLQTLTITPGAEVIIPISTEWDVKPFAQLGYGSDMVNETNTVIWGTGIRTRLTFGNDSNWIIGGEFLRAVNNPRDNAPKTSFTRWGAGIEYKYQTNWELHGRRISLHTRLLQWYFDDVAVFLPPVERLELRSATELGFSFGVDPPITILGYDFVQGGIGYEKADKVTAITFFTTFPF